MSNILYQKIILGILCATLHVAASAIVVMKATANKNLEYPSLLSGKYNSAITKPRSVLGFDVGQKTATPEQINELVNLWANKSSKANIIEYARTYEGRSLHYLVISSMEINKESVFFN